MPEPPLLLADRVVRLEAEPLSLGTGTVWTETDIAPGAWYLHDNRMPAGIMIEAGQADLLLVSWLGVDALNRGERVYRLLGCELTYHGGLPVAGETLRYEIGVDGHAQQGAVRLFFFHSTCTVAGIPRLTVRDGQAGFFTDEELAGSAGVLWDPATDRAAGRGAGRSAAGVRRAGAALPRAARGVCGRAGRRVLRPRLRGGRGAHPHPESAGRPAAAARRGDGHRRRGRALGTRVSARRGSHRPGRLVLRGALHERPLHARDADVRGRPAGDGGLPGGARVSRWSGTAGASSRCRTSRT